MKRNIISFDYVTLAKKYNINTKTLNKLLKEVYKDFPHDEMLAELHVIRAIKAYKNNID